MVSSASRKEIPPSSESLQQLVVGALYSTVDRSLCLCRFPSLPTACPVGISFTPHCHCLPQGGGCSVEVGHEGNSWFQAKKKTSWKEMMPEFLAHRSQGRSWYTEGMGGEGKCPGSFWQQRLRVRNGAHRRGPLSVTPGSRSRLHGSRHYRTPRGRRR